MGKYRVSLIEIWLIILLWNASLSNENRQQMYQLKEIMTSPIVSHIYLMCSKHSSWRNSSRKFSLLKVSTLIKGRSGLLFLQEKSTSKPGRRGTSRRSTIYDVVWSVAQGMHSGPRHGNRQKFKYLRIHWNCYRLVFRIWRIPPKNLVQKYSFVKKLRGFEVGV